MSDFEVLEHNYGKFLRLGSPNDLAKQSAADLLALFEKELNAEIDDKQSLKDFGLSVPATVLIRLEDLHVELASDGNAFTLVRVAGSRREFEDLCEFVREQLETTTD